MNARKQKLEALFESALALGEARERAAYLDDACAGDTELRHEVEELLRAAEAAQGFLGAGAGEGASTAAEIPSRVLAPLLEPRE